jgi:hypothetical protein
MAAAVLLLASEQARNDGLVLSGVFSLVSRNPKIFSTASSLTVKRRSSFFLEVSVSFTSPAEQKTQSQCLSSVPIWMNRGILISCFQAWHCLVPRFPLCSRRLECFCGVVCSGLFCMIGEMRRNWLCPSALHSPCCGPIHLDATMNELQRIDLIRQSKVKTFWMGGHHPSE